MPEKNTSTRGIFLLLLFLSAIAAGAILKLMSSVVLPVVVSVMLSLVFYPVIRKLNEKLHFPWWVAIVVVFVVFFGIIGSMANILTTGFSSIMESLPAYEERLNTIYARIAGEFQIEVDKDMTFVENMWSHISIRNTIGKYALSFTNVIYNFSRNLLLVVLFSVFLLAEMNATKEKIRKAFEEDGAETGKVKGIAHKIVTDVTRYIFIKFIMSAATGIVVTIGVLLAHLKFPLVWGFLAFLLNFIPTFGSIISGVLTVLFALIQFYPSWGVIIYIAILMLATNMIIGSIVEPRVQGQNLGISPFIILVSLSLWGWMWGFVGMLIAVPIMVIIKIICENISYLKPIAILIGGKPKEEKDLPADNTSGDSQKENADPLP